MMRYFLLLALGVSSILAADRELPSRTSAVLRLLDYVDSEHQSAGQTFRALLQTDLIVGGKLVAPGGSRTLLRMVTAGEASELLSLEWFAIRLGEDWAEIRAGAKAPGSATALLAVEDRRAQTPEIRPLLSRGPTLYIPGGSILRFETTDAARLVSVGPERVR